MNQPAAHEEWLERAEIYALGALDGEELARFEAHLAAGCRICEPRLQETREALTALPRSLAPEAPPAEVKARLLAQIARDRPDVERVAHRRASRWLWWGAWASTVAMAGFLAVVSWRLSAALEEVARLHDRIAALQSRVTEQEATLRFLSDPAIRYVSLAGLPASPGASGWLLWNPVSSTGLLLARGLPQPPADHAYELWALAGTEPVPAGVFTVDPVGRALLHLPTLPAGKPFDKFAVTLEPAGGVPQPTGPMHLLGQL